MTLSIPSLIWYTTRFTGSSGSRSFVGPGLAQPLTNASDNRAGMHEGRRGAAKRIIGSSGQDFKQLDCCIVTTISGGTNGIGGSIACLCHWELPKCNSANIKAGEFAPYQAGKQNDDSTFCNCYVLCGARLACAVSVCANVSGQAH